MSLPNIAPIREVFRALEAIRIGLSVPPPDESEKRIATMIKSFEEVAQAAAGIAQPLRLDHVSHVESAVIAAIRRHLQAGRWSGPRQAVCLI